MWGVVRRWFGETMKNDLEGLKNIGVCFSSVGASKIYVFIIFPDLERINILGGSAALAKPLN